MAEQIETESTTKKTESPTEISAFIDGKEGRSGIIQVRDLFKIYRVGSSRVHALDGVSFDIAKGEFISIVGPSGSGKSTCLNMLAGLEPPSYGSIYISRTNIANLTEAELVAFRREHVGFVFQSFNLIPTMTALENVALPLAFRQESRSIREKKALIMLHLMGLQDKVWHKPNELSGGQQQRVGIARALVVNPDIIFADEPTGNLDSVNSKEIMRLMKGISRRHNQTFVMVTHDSQLAEYGDRIFHIIDGQITSVERGKFADLQTGEEGAEDE